MQKTPCIYVNHALIRQALETPASAGAKLLEPFKSFAAEHNLPFKVLEDHEVANDAEIHMEMADLWLCLEGRVTFIVDGELKNPKPRLNTDGSQNPQELVAPSIEGGRTIELHPGDWLWVPAGQPHQHICKDTVRMMIIKIPNS